MIHVYDSELKSCLFVWMPNSFDIDLLWTTMCMLLDYWYHAIHGKLISINKSVHLTTSICGMPSRSGDYVGEVYLVSPVYGDIQMFIFGMKARHWIITRCFWCSSNGELAIPVGCVMLPAVLECDTCSVARSIDEHLFRRQQCVGLCRDYNSASTCRPGIPYGRHMRGKIEDNVGPFAWV